MRGGRMLVIIGLIVVVGAVVVGALLWSRRNDTPVPPDFTPEAGVEGVIPPAGQEIVVAAQDIPRGTTIASDTVRLASWPDESVPEGHLIDIEEALDRMARVDIVLGMPILEGMLTDEVSDLAAIGSDVALQIPSGMVAYALPVKRYSSVAWAIQPGDYVDVIISLLVVELDEEFQTTLPNSASCVQPPEGEGCQSGVMGRLEVLPNGWVVNLMPTENQRPRLVTQLTVQNAMVLRVGDWPGAKEMKPDEEQLTEDVEGAPAPTPVPREPIQPLTLVVTPQDAMVLKYAEEIGASIDLVLRSAADTGPITTDSITLQYLFDRFNIELPPKLPYGVTSALQSFQSSVGDVGRGEPVEE